MMKKLGEERKFLALYKGQVGWDGAGSSELTMTPQQPGSGTMTQNVIALALS